MKVFFERSISARAFTIAEKNFILTILNDKRAWPFTWQVTNTREFSNWNVSLESQAYIDAVMGHSTDVGLSVTYMTRRPRATLFSYENWLRVPEPLNYTVMEYRVYLVLHECGHGLGLGHARRPTSGRAPIMIQQSRGLGPLQKNLWPLDSEVKKLANGAL